ncbi:MAG: hypothetical protein GY851_31885 [bacterium]|nr:hypothetical protein [bacterium]
MSYDDFDIDKARDLREKAKKSLLRQSRKNLVVTLLSSLVLVALVSFAVIQRMWALDSEGRVFYSMLALFGLLMNTALWAVYALDARILFVLKETKQLRLDVLSCGEAPSERATGGAESFSTWTSDVLQPKVQALVVILICVVASAFAFIANAMTSRYPEEFGGQEVAEVHVTPEGAFRVVSRISITRCPANVSEIPLRIPQPGATLESVAIDGRDIPAVPVPDKADTYTILPGLPKNALMSATVEVVWSPKAADIEIEDDHRSFNLQLRGMIPINAYALNAIIDDGASYRFAYGDPSYEKGFNQYWTLRSDGGYHDRPMGSCGVHVDAIPHAE